MSDFIYFAYETLRELSWIAYRVIIGTIKWSARKLLDLFRKFTGMEEDEFNQFMETFQEKIFNVSLVLSTLVVLAFVPLLLSSKSIDYAVLALLIQSTITYALIRDSVRS